MRKQKYPISFNLLSLSYHLSVTLFFSVTHNIPLGLFFSTSILCTHFTFKLGHFLRALTGNWSIWKKTKQQNTVFEAKSKIHILLFYFHTYNIFLKGSLDIKCLKPRNKSNSEVCTQAQKDSIGEDICDQIHIGTSKITTVKR